MLPTTAPAAPPISAPVPALPPLSPPMAAPPSAPLAAPLIAGPWPLLQVWGADDELVPAVAYERFAAQAASRSAPYCPRSLPGADHGLQRPGHDGVQQVWGWLEQWARRPQAGPCAEGETP